MCVCVLWLLLLLLITYSEFGRSLEGYLLVDTVPELGIFQFTCHQNANQRNGESPLLEAVMTDTRHKSQEQVDGDASLGTVDTGIDLGQHGASFLGRSGRELRRNISILCCTVGFSSGSSLSKESHSSTSSATKRTSDFFLAFYSGSWCQHLHSLTSVIFHFTSCPSCLSCEHFLTGSANGKITRKNFEKIQS